MLSLFTIKPTEKNLAIARAAQIYYHKGAYADKPVDQKPEVKAEKKPEAKAEQQKPVAEKKPEVKAEKPVEQKSEAKADQKPEVKAEKKPETKADQKKPVEQAEQKKPEQKKPAEAVEKKPVEQAEQKKPADKPEQKPVEQAEQKKPVDQKKPADKPEQKPEVKAEKKPEAKAEQQKPVEPVVEPVVEVLDSKGNIVAMLPGVPEEAPKAAKTASGFDINNFVKPKQSKQTSAKEFRDTKNIDEVYGFMRSAGVPGPFDPMPGFSLNEKVTVLKKYANFNGTHPGLDVIQLNTLIMVFNSPDLSRRMVDCGLDPKQVLGVRKFNEVPVGKYDSNDAYDFAFEYSISKKKKLVLLLNSIPTYDPKNGWMSAYNITVR